MREGGVRAARENRRHVAPVAREAIVSDGVDAGVDTVQTPSGGAVTDRSSAEPEFEQLVERHDAVLRERKVSDQPLQRTVWRITAV